VSQAGAPTQAVFASAPGRLELSGASGGPRLLVALDRRALCRVEAETSGFVVEAKQSLTRTSARDAAELVALAPAAYPAHALIALGARPGLRVVTEWKLPVGAGISGEAALVLATTAAVSRAVGRELEPRELVALAREVASGAGLVDDAGLEAALRGGVVLARPGAGPLEAGAVAVDPGRIDESLMVVDAGDAAALPGGAEAPPAPDTALDAAVTERMANALVGGRYEEVVDLVAADSEGRPASDGQRRIAELVRRAGGAARWQGAGGLVAVWAPPGERGPGRREAVRAALEAAGFKALPLRVDLRGLELD